MENILLNIFTQNLFRMTNKKFIYEVEIILNRNSLKYDINNRLLEIEYLHNYSTIIDNIDPYQKAKIRIYKDAKFVYTHKNHAIKFIYNKTKLPSSFGLININIVNVYSYYIINILLKYQSKFLYSKLFIDLKYMHYDILIEKIKYKYNIVIYKSHISNFIKKTIF
jgi:hypothetical protein